MLLLNNNGGLCLDKTDLLPFSFLTCKEGHEHGHPAQYVGPGEAPVTKASAQEVDCHSSINGHTQQNKESWEGDRGCMSVTVNVRVIVLCVCANSEEARLTGDKKHDSCSKGAVEPFKGGEVSKGHDPSDDAGKA